jgi:hypothetical protein
MQAGLVGVADVHAGALAHGLKAFEALDVGGFVGGFAGVFTGALSLIGVSHGKVGFLFVFHRRGRVKMMLFYVKGVARENTVSGNLFYEPQTHVYQKFTSSFRFFIPA